MLEAGTKIGAYRIDRRLGEGGMGEVYAAFDETTETPVALKVLSSDAEKDREAVGRFKREASALQAFKNHPGVVEVLDFDRTADGVVYLVMELLDGQTLAEWIRNQRESIALEDALTIARQIAETMADVHDADVIHRDLKPGNVMLVSDEKERLGIRPKIFDFGIAKVHVLTGDDEQATTLPKTRGFIGTPRYAAPEQSMPGKANTDKIDVYALGLILYEMLAGKRLFESEDGFEEIYKRHNIEPGVLSELLPEVPRGLVELMGEMLAKKPEDRPTMRACAARMARGWEAEANARRSKRMKYVARRWSGTVAVMIAGAGILGLMWRTQFESETITQPQNTIEELKTDTQLTSTCNDSIIDADWEYGRIANTLSIRKEQLLTYHRELMQSTAAAGSLVCMIKVEHRLSDLERLHGTLDAAENYVNAARIRIDHGLAKAPKDAQLSLERAMNLSKRGKLRLAKGDTSAALFDFENSIAVLEDRGVKTDNEKSMLATSCLELGEAQWLSGNANAAMRAYEKAIDLRRSVASTNDPYWKAMHVEALVLRSKLSAEANSTIDDLKKADSAMQALIETAEHDLLYRFIRAKIHLQIGMIHKRRHDLKRATDSFQAARDIASALRKGANEHKEYGLLLIDTLGELSLIAGEEHDFTLKTSLDNRRCDVAKNFTAQDALDKRFDLKGCS
ncbi:MAG: serine/threonine protein kinase [Polyangiaceae bacterium]|nr:serine/threonine protein kinase [Polyangiaceae bacterium]